MIDTIQDAYRWAQDVTIQDVKDFYHSSVPKVKAAVKKALLFITGVFLFITNPTFFAVGFVAGIVFQDNINEAIDKIKLVWKQQPHHVTLIATIGCFFGLPISMATFSFFYGANTGCQLMKEATSANQNPIVDN